MRFFVVSFMLFALFSGRIWALEFSNPEKHYRFDYDEKSLELVSPGFLTTDLVVRKKESENGFFPNLVILSRTPTPGTSFEQEVEKMKTTYSQIFPQMNLSRSEAFTFKGSPGYLMELSYQRDPYHLFLRALLIQTPSLLMSVNLTTPLETKDDNLSLFIGILNTLTIEEIPPS